MRQETISLNIQPFFENYVHVVETRYFYDISRLPKAGFERRTIRASIVLKLKYCFRILSQK